MGDLARGLVEVARFSERRRTSRRQLRESVEVVVAALIAELRSGDSVEVDFDADPDLGVSGRWRYTVRRVKGSVEHIDDDVPDFIGGTTKWFHENTLTAEGPLIEGARYPTTAVALIDVRDTSVIPDEWKRVRFAPLLIDEREIGWPIASDDDLVRFGHHASAVVDAFRARLAAEARRYGDAADALTKLAPK